MSNPGGKDTNYVGAPGLTQGRTDSEGGEEEGEEEGRKRGRRRGRRRRQKIFYPLRPKRSVDLGRRGRREREGPNKGTEPLTNSKGLDGIGWWWLPH